MRWLFVAIVNLVLLLGLVAGLPFRLLRRGKRPAYVRFRLSGDPPYRRRQLRRPRFGQRRPEPGTIASLEELGEALELLAGDAAVRGILLEVEGFAAPPAKRDALQALLQRFRGRGKRVVAWTVSADTAAYQMLCAADEILLSPAGRVDLIGYAAEATALAEGLGRAGIQAHFIRRGDYKTAPELFTHRQISDIQRQTLEAFLDERYDELVRTVSQARRRRPEEIRSLVDQGPYSARRAQEVGLVDGLCTESELPRRLGLVEKDDEEGSVEGLSSYRASLPFPPPRWRRLQRPPRLGLVTLNGMIVGGRGGALPGGAQVAGAERVVRALRAAGRDRRTRALLLYVSSPGGSAVASELILEAVQRVARRKPVIAFVDRVAASGGYMAALGAKEIWATPHSVLGSIGVFAGKFDLSGLFERLGVHRTLVTRGENAAIYSAARGFTPGERASLEREIEEIYQAFLGHVARARGRTLEEIHARAEGRVYSGTRALAAGLVDRTGGFEEACRRALALAEVPEIPFELVSYGPRAGPFSLWKLLRGGALAGVAALCLTCASLAGFGDGERFD